jgi:hypothetical protein
MKKTPIMLSLLLALLISTTALSAETMLLRSQRKPGQTDRVVVRLEVGGDTKYSDQGKPKRDKLSVTCDLDYVEKLLELPDKVDGLWRSVRDYQKASADVKVGDGQYKPALKPEHRRIATEAAKQTALLFSPDGAISREELDAIDVPVNTLLLDRLLPDKPVQVGDQWSHGEELMAAMLGLDEVAKSTVQSTLKEVTAARALMEISGRVEGAAYGVSTAVKILGRYRLNLQTKRIDWLGMLIEEVREPSFVADGMDGTSKLTVLVTPAKEPANLADMALAKLNLKSTPDATRLYYESPDGAWHCRLDRRWTIHHQRPKSSAAVLRFLDRGKFAGQCNLASLVDRDPGKLVSLEEFQDDIRKALGKSFGEFVEAKESTNPSGYRVSRVVAHGIASEIPMRWIYYLVTDPKGRRAAFTFAVEQNQVERFADADAVLVSSLRFLADKQKIAKDKE